MRPPERWPFSCLHHTEPVALLIESGGIFHGETTMAQAKLFSPDELVSSPMVCTSLLLPRVLLDAIDEAAVRDEPCSPNRSSLMRRWLIAGLRREAA